MMPSPMQELDNAGCCPQCQDCYGPGWYTCETCETCEAVEEDSDDE